ncbi:MAG: bifunctional methylenetetrahydrofolate dehydrogenase/methenyltetrahydrofolate cyclohydrolase FolD [Proteobacteria bacterium]|nr:bifunctional methylenetetrahydrofolate dehydrogenase/methenyltetrahydrofolate cyclohydrolase FolD [Pseudomonadota bacterium]MDA1355711.1 bifunctional methylenetetrahydrofolate dehydrogenase/methenyltetrahydrofolate cyclohydrolase FolD [Pseudomonadota bacterium]
MSDANITDGKAMIIDGKAMAADLRADIGRRVAILKERHGVTPGLSVVLVGEDPASEVYVRNKGKSTLEAGMNSNTYKLPVSASHDEVMAKVVELNNDPTVHGILVQLPLPDQVDSDAILNAINPDKDVDGFHTLNVGRLHSGQDAMVPCTPVGCLLMLKKVIGDLSGMQAIVVGRSNIVGKPMAALLLKEHCTVTIAHSRTRDLAAECRRADIVIAAVGRASMVKGDWIKPGATVIDVGINRIDDASRKSGTRLVGDLDFDEAVKVAGAITPVPGGVGPMTIACLLKNTLTAACRQAGVPEPE